MGDKAVESGGIRRVLQQNHIDEGPHQHDHGWNDKDQPERWNGAAIEREHVVQYLVRLCGRSWLR